MQGGADPQLVAPVLQAADYEEISDEGTPPVSPQGLHNSSQQSIILTPTSSPHLVLSLTPVVLDLTPPLADQDPVPPEHRQGGDDGVQHVAGPQFQQQQAAAVPIQNTPPPSQPSQDVPVDLEDLPPYHVVHRQHIPTITHIPKAARSDWTRLYTSVCYRVANNPANLANHILYSMLARVILPAGKSPPHPGDTTQANKIKDRIRRWRGGEFRALWEEAIAMQKMPAKKRKKKKQQESEVTQESRNAIRSSRLVKEGQYSRAAQALTSAGLVDQNPTSTAAMLHLHPQGPRVIPSADEPDEPAMTFDREHVLKCIKSFKSGSAPGPSGLRAEHIKVAVKKVPRNRADKALDAVTKLVCVLGAGHLPEEAAPYFAGARLFGGKKKDGGIRPIAVGNITRRLVSKCFSSAVN